MEVKGLNADEGSEIAGFFAGKRVLITGATGFIGSVLLEKLLRTCPGIDKIYVLMRAKKGKSLEQRLRDQLEGPLFERLRLERRGAHLKVQALRGDCALPGLGLDGDSLQRLREVHVVFHVAATVRFDEKMRLAAAVNVQSTVDLLDIASTVMTDLKAFVHISTAYSFPQNKEIEERFYEPAMSATQLLNIVHNTSDEMLESITPQLIASWPNTYSFTKAVAEAAVRERGRGLPVVVVRPSIVMSTAREPLPGWTNNANGPSGVISAAMLGLARVLHCDADRVADVVPVDMVVSGMVAAAWDAAARPRHHREEEVETMGAGGGGATLERVDRALALPEPVVLNLVSSVDQPITWAGIRALTRCTSTPREQSEQSPASDSGGLEWHWHYELLFTKTPALYALQVALLHLLPALAVDAGRRLVGKKPFLWKAYAKIHKLTQILTYFTTGEWRFRNDNAHRIWERLNATDRQVFDFNMKTLKWEPFFRTYMRGLRNYLEKDCGRSVSIAGANYAKFKIIQNYSVSGGILIFCALILMHVLRWSCMWRRTDYRSGGGNTSFLCIDPNACS